MARLMVIPLEDRGDAVLIVTRCTEDTLMGFVANATLTGFVEQPLSMCECVAFVDRHLPSVERILLEKSIKENYADARIVCVEITAADLACAGIAQSF